MKLSRCLKRESLLRKDYMVASSLATSSSKRMRGSTCQSRKMCPVRMSYLFDGCQIVHEQLIISSAIGRFDCLGLARRWYPKRNITKGNMITPSRKLTAAPGLSCNADLNEMLS